MSLNHFNALAVATISLLMFSGTVAHAESIAIVNPSFESMLDSNAASYDLPNGAYVPFNGASGNLVGGTVPPAGVTLVGWTSTGTNNGTYDVAPTYFALANVTGENVVYQNTAEIIQQVLTGTTLQAGTYVLAADVGSFSGTAYNDAPILALKAGGVDPVVGVSGGAGGAGALLPVTSTFTILPGNSFLGQELSIVLSRTGSPSFGNGMVFDNVSLTFTPVPVPEPGSSALLAICIPALAVVHRWKKQSIH